MIEGETGTDDQWWQDAVIYELHVRAFKDGNGDGIGDFRGLTEKLDYLQDLGVTALWLLPFYPSPLRDDGYDIADYESIHSDYGTLPQFRRFVDEAHERDLRVITELVINHTSDQHPWFKRAVQAPPGSPERDFYVWSDTPEKWPDVRVIFQDFESSNWTWHGEAGAYYWHRFYHHQPDLNFDNPEVRQAVKDALDHWAAMGVDGMRLDAIPYLYERDGTNGENLPETHAFLKELRAHLDEKWPGRMFLAEANQWPEDAAAYFGDGDECHMNFHFPLMPRLFMSVAQEDRFPIIDILQQTPEIPDGAQWGVFLRNHDELTLEMVTDEERDYMYRAYAHDPRMRVNLGIRRRLAPLLRNDRRLIELMNSLLLAMPGTPVVYYGDEIGMGDNIYLGDRNGVRTPMQWSPDRNAGFSDANPQRLYLPVVIDPEYHYEAVNVEAQHNNPSSLLWWMKRMIALRKRHPVFGRGSIRFLTPDNNKVLAFVREHDEEQVLVVANLSRHSQAVHLDLSEFAGEHLVELQGGSVFPRVADQPYLLTLGPYQFHWFLIERSREHLSPSDRRELAAEEAPSRPEPPTVTVHGEWTALLKARGRERLEQIMPELLRRQRWFGGKSRSIRGTTIADVLPLEDGSFFAILVVTVDYRDGEPEDYVLPVAFAEGEEAGRLESSNPMAILADVEGRGRGVSGVLYDPMLEPVAGDRLLAVLAEEEEVEGTAGALRGSLRPAVDLAAGHEEARPLGAEQSNTSLRYGDRYLLKLLRKLEPGISPDVEVTRLLTDDGRFEHVPPLLGTIDYHDAGRPSAARTLAVLQEYVPNEADAWSVTLTALDRFAESILSAPPEAEVTAERGETRTLTDLAGSTIPTPVTDLLGGYLEVARLLGQRTAELHTVLATADGGPDFAPEAFTALYRRSLYQSMRNSVRKGLAAAGRQADRLPDQHDRERVRALAAREGDILARMRQVADTDIDTVRIRTHGDYHLGQVLWTGKDVVIIDFEGEPARPLSERRIKRSPLRDVAGMLRSFDYAAHAALRDQEQRGAVAPDGPAHAELSAWLAFWSRWVQATHLRSYLDEAGDSGILPEDPVHVRVLLDAYLMEKGVYELGYEMNNRPDWVRIPIGGIERILSTPID